MSGGEEKKPRVRKPRVSPKVVKVQEPPMPPVGYESVPNVVKIR